MRPGTQEIVDHLLDGIASSRKHVCRTVCVCVCVCAGEVLAAAAATVDLIATALCLHEMLTGTADSAEANRPLVDGPLSFHTVLATGSMSMVSAFAATALRVPREKRLTIHLFWLKETRSRFWKPSMVGHQGHCL